MERHSRDKARLLSEMHKNSKRENALKLEHRKFLTKKFFFVAAGLFFAPLPTMVRVTKHQNRSPRKAAVSPSLQIYKT